MGNVQRVLETVFCEAPGCPEDAAPEARYCTRHMRRLAGEAASALVDLAPPPKETTVDPGPPAVTCRVDGCVLLAAPHTIGARRQGGRYDMCEMHLEELTQRTRETRRANREAEERRRADHAASRSPRSHVPVPAVSPEADREEEVGAAGSPAGEGTETAPPQELDWRAEAAARGQLGFGVRNGAGEREWTGDAPLPPIEQAPEPGDVELDVCQAWCVIDGFPHEGECRDFAGRSERERLDQHVTQIVVPAAHPRQFDYPSRAVSAETLDVDTMRAAAGYSSQHVGPERAPTWAERGVALATVGEEIDELEARLDTARARWRALSSG